MYVCLYYVLFFVCVVLTCDSFYRNYRIQYLLFFLFPMSFKPIAKKTMTCDSFYRNYRIQYLLVFLFPMSFKPIAQKRKMNNNFRFRQMVQAFIF